MKVQANKSFLESLKNLNSLKNKWYSVRGWFKYHFTKGNNNLMKVAWKGRPWDVCFLYELEKAKIEEMIAYHTKANRYVGVEDDIKWMKLCVKLIDIFTEKVSLFHYTGKLKFIPIEGTDDCELNGDDLVYHCDVNVNTRNAARFVPMGENYQYIEYWKKHAHELYIKKAKSLYHKIRLEKDDAWWD